MSLWNRDEIRIVVVIYCHTHPQDRKFKYLSMHVRWFLNHWTYWRCSDDELRVNISIHIHNYQLKNSWSLVWEILWCGVSGSVNNLIPCKRAKIEIIILWSQWSLYAMLNRVTSFVFEFLLEQINIIYISDLAFFYPSLVE